MLKNAHLILFIVAVCIAKPLFAQNKRVKSITIKHVSFSILTDEKINCEDFEKDFGEEMVITEIGDTAINTQIIKRKNKLVKDSLSMYLPDTRGKIIIIYEDGNADVICLSNFAICLNGSPMKFDKKFLDYIKDIITHTKKRVSLGKQKHLNKQAVSK